MDNFICYCGFEGSLTLVSGDPGVGKSTLLLQVCITFSKVVINFFFMDWWTITDNVELKDDSIDSRRIQWQWSVSNFICLWWRGMLLVSFLIVLSHAFHQYPRHIIVLNCVCVKTTTNIFLYLYSPVKTFACCFNIS